MENITSATELKKIIQRLEIEQAIDGQLLKEQFYFAFESLKPVNILRNTLYEITTSPHMMDSILGTAVGLASGYVSRKIAMIGASGSLVFNVFFVKKETNSNNTNGSRIKIPFLRKNIHFLDWFDCVCSDIVYPAGDNCSAGFRNHLCHFAPSGR